MISTLYLLFALLGIFIMLLLIIRTKLHVFIALLLMSIVIGLISGMPLSQILHSIQVGMGGTLGFVAVVVGLGAMFGQMLEVSGGAEKLAQSLLNKFGEKKAPWALGLTGFLLAIPVFFDIALIILIPILYGLAKKTGRSLLYYGIPLLAGLAVTHSFIPPTPGPIIVSNLIGADAGWVILFGLIAGIPAMILAGPVYGSYISKKIDVKVPEYMDIQEVSHNDKVLPDFDLIAGLILVPLVLILLNTFSGMLLPNDHIARTIFEFLGHPFIALLIATILSFYCLGTRRGYTTKEVQFIANKALEPAGIIILVTGAGGVFKQILLDSGMGNTLADTMALSPLPPLILAFLIAGTIRIAQGSATVAMVTTASLLAPLIYKLGLEGPMLGLMVISIASGSTIMSHMNDSGFWIVNRYFGLNVKDTLLSWTALETIIGLVGFAVVLLLSLFV